MNCPDGCGLDKPEISGYEPEEKKKKNGRPRKPVRFRYYRVKGFMSGAVYSEVIQAETDLQALQIAKHTWGLPIIRYGASKTEEKS